MVLWRSKQKLDMQSTGCRTSAKRPATMRHKGLRRTVMTCEMQLLASIIALTSYICQATFILTFCAGEWKPFLFLLQNNRTLIEPWKPKSLVYLNPCPVRKRQRVPWGHDSESAKPVSNLKPTTWHWQSAATTPEGTMILAHWTHHRIVCALKGLSDVFTPRQWTSICHARMQDFKVYDNFLCSVQTTAKVIINGCV